MNGLVGCIHINDKDPGIHAFWQTLLRQPDALCSWIEQATSTFFLDRTNISGILSGGPIGGLRQAGKYTLTARLNKPELIRRIRQI